MDNYLLQGVTVIIVWLVIRVFHVYQKIAFQQDLIKCNSTQSSDFVRVTPDACCKNTMTDREKLTHFIGIYCYTSPRVCVCVNDMKKSHENITPIITSFA